MTRSDDRKLPGASKTAGKLKDLLAPICFAALNTPVISFACLVMVTVLMPHHSEGIRNVISAPWPIYTALVLFFPMVVMYLLSSYAFRNTRQRIVSLVTSLLVFLPLWPLILGIAHQAYIGK